MVGLELHRNALVQDFSLACDSFGIDKKCYEHILNKIVRYYDQPWRFYHNREHIIDLLEHYHSIPPDHIHNPAHIVFAIFFHDIIYNPGKLKDNSDDDHLPTILPNAKTVNDSLACDEYFSIQRFHYFAIHEAKPNPISLSSIELISHLIELTRDHLKANLPIEFDNVPEGNLVFPSDETDASFFLDMDLAILGSNPKHYSAYSCQIRQEYSHLDDEMFCEGRKAVLRKILNAPRIYRSTLFFQKFERIARENISKELAKLSSCKSEEE